MNDIKIIDLLISETKAKANIVVNSVEIITPVNEFKNKQITQEFFEILTEQQRYFYIYNNCLVIKRIKKK